MGIKIESIRPGFELIYQLCKGVLLRINIMRIKFVFTVGALDEGNDAINISQQQSFCIFRLQNSYE
jgi:hypothetical protein